jgi:Na+-driven multidrug efflux pump
MLVAAFAMLCVALGIPGAHAFFVLLGAHGRALDLADQYITIWFIGFVFFATSMVGTALMRSAGNAVMPGVVMTVGSLLQVLLAPFLIFGWIGLPALGIAGAAWAFVMARFISFLLTLHSLAFNERLLRGSLHGWLDSTRQILHVGIPAVASNLVPPLSTGIVTRLLAGFGHAVVAGFSVASRLEAVMSMVVIAVGASVGPFVGQNWGAHRFERVREALRLCNRFCVTWGFASFVLMWACARFLVHLINQEPDVVDAASHYLVIIPLGLGFMGVMGVSSACFNALGKPIPPLALSMLRLIVLLIPLALIGRSLAGYQGVFVATTITSIIVGILAWTWNSRTVRGDAKAIRAAEAA